MNKLMICGVLTLLLAGCGTDEHVDLKQWMDDNSRNLVGKVEPLPEVKPYEPYIYEAFSLPDPFSPAKLKVEKGKGSSLAPNSDRAKEALEAYDLEKLKMVGTLSRGKEMYALIQSPDNNTYRVKPGNYIGQNFGLITSISESEIKLKEIVEDTNGDWVERTSTIVLDEQSEQKK